MFWVYYKMHSSLSCFLQGQSLLIVDLIAKWYYNFDTTIASLFMVTFKDFLSFLLAI